MCTTHTKEALMFFPMIAVDLLLVSFLVMILHVATKPTAIL
jgi:hypothetical protein